MERLVLGRASGSTSIIVLRVCRIYMYLLTLPFGHISYIEVYPGTRQAGLLRVSDAVYSRHLVFRRFSPRKSLKGRC